jgi:hypothetical protein
MRNSILTKDNLLERGWHGDDTCHFCGMKESVNHLLLNWFVARPVWSILRCAFDLREVPDNINDLYDGYWLPNL